MAPGSAKLHSAVKTSCILSTFGVILSGVPDVWAVVRNGSTGTKSILPYCTMLLDNMIGCWLSRESGDEMGLCFRTLSLVMTSAYIVAYVAYADKRRSAMNMVIAVLALFGSYYAGMIALVPPKHWQDVLGVTVTASAVSFAASPLADLGKILKTKDASSLPANLLSMLLWCSVSWASYGLLLKKIWMVIPNMINAFLAFAQLALALTFAHGGTSAAAVSRAAGTPASADAPRSGRKKKE